MKWLVGKDKAKEVLSSPTRGMWIEIFPAVSSLAVTAVIPHTGDVD